MGLVQRQKLYDRLEKLRKRPLVVYMTSTRPGVAAAIASDVVGEILRQLEALPAGTQSLDLLIVSYGGDPTVAWRVASLIRERVKEFSVLIPQAAFSAATLLALGADKIVMHPNGNLGPTDPQITSRRTLKDGSPQQQTFGSQDLAAFLKFARDEIGLTDQAHLLEVLKQFCEQVGPVPIGVAARSSQLSESMGEKLLRLHMTGEAEKQKAHSISQHLNRSFFHHGYPVSRTEAKEIGLEIADGNMNVEKVMWSIWLDLEEEFKLREPFNPLSLLKNDANCQGLFSPAPILNWPANLPQNVANHILGQLLPQMIVLVPPTRYSLLAAVVESTRLASRSVTEGSIFATRGPDLQIKVQVLPDVQGWVDADLATGEIKKTQQPPAASLASSDQVRVQPAHPGPSEQVQVLPPQPAVTAGVSQVVVAEPLHVAESVQFGAAEATPVAESVKVTMVEPPSPSAPTTAETTSNPAKALPGTDKSPLLETVGRQRGKKRRRKSQNLS